MTEHPQKRLIAANHWTLKMGFLVGVFFGGMLLLGEVLSMPAINAIVSGILPYDICERLLDHEHVFPWASLLIVMLLVAPVMIGQAAAAKLLSQTVDKIPGGK